MSSKEEENIRGVFHRLAALDPLPVPEGESGVILRDWPPESAAGAVGASTAATEIKTEIKYVPILSMYLDLRPEIQGAMPAERPGRATLRGRLHQIEATFAPRGAAFDAVHEGSAAIESYLDKEVPAAASGVAIFVSPPHHLFETLITTVPLQTQVVAGALPDLFQLARVLADQETAVVAVVEVNTARLFLLHQGGLRELRTLADDPKYFHMVRGANAMSQAHYQRHALQTREKFAAEVARQIEQLVETERASQVILEGEVEALPLLRAALSRPLAKLVRELPRSLGSTEFSAPADTILEQVEPLVQESRAEHERSIVERLVEAVQSDRLGVAGLESTRRALSLGQVETLVLAADVAKSAGISDETCSELINLATRTDADIAVVVDSPQLQRLGSVGALLRYRVAPASLA
jgi:hypothetical protein